MCDYYEFSKSLFDFFYKSECKKHKYKELKVLYNIEIHGLSDIEIVIFTPDELLFEYTKNKLTNKESELRYIINQQLFIAKYAKITYTHAPDIDAFEEERDRNAEIDYIVKYYK